MDQTTLIVAVIGSVLALVLSPIRALCAYLCVLLLHSQDLNLSVGTIDFSSARIVAIILFARIFLMSPRLLRVFRWNLLDTLVTLFFISQVVSLLNTEPLMVVLENRSGRFVETLLPYFMCRAVLRTKNDLLTLMKTLILISIPLAIFGVIESSTGRNLIGTHGPLWRDGHYRAFGTFGVHIGFGLFFAAVAPLCVGLWYQGVWPRLFLLICLIINFIGLLSTWSSGPIFAIYTYMSFLILYTFRKFWPIVLSGSIILYLLIELLSNRSAIAAMSRLGISASTWEYRVQLYKYVFQGGMTNHWLFGWGLVGIDSDFDRFPWVCNDMTSLYVSELVRYGVVAFFCLAAIIIRYYRCIYIAFQASMKKQDQFLIWNLCGGMVGWNVALATVNTVGQTMSILFLFFAVATNIYSCIFVEHKLHKIVNINQSNLAPAVIGCTNGI